MCVQKNVGEGDSSSWGAYDRAGEYTWGQPSPTLVVRARWQTFPEFLDALERRSAVMDFAPQIGHAAVRSYVLGERCADPSYTPSSEEVAAMADLVEEAVVAGAAGFSSTFAEIHMDVHGNNVPGCYASESEVHALAAAASRGGNHAVYECAGAPDVQNQGLRALEAIGHLIPVTFTLVEAQMERSLAWL
eukprot:COSAG01_NODE_2909_length_6876_cov_2.019171_8_plen_190_part_00